MQCRSHVSQLGRLHKDFQAAGAEILVILGEAPERARQYAELLKLPFPVLADPGRAIYHLYELDRAIFGIQRTTSLVVDQNGVIQYIKRAINPTLWLQESRALLNFVKGLGGT
jgi:peroxiredoxin